MASSDFHVNFSHQGINFDLDFVKDAKSDHLVKINGIYYAVLGEKKNLAIACAILKSISLDSISNSEDLQKKLSQLGDISIPKQKTEGVGITTLQGVEKEKDVSAIAHKSAWRRDEEANLPQTLLFVARTYWDGRKNRGDHADLRKFLGEKAFDKALESNDFEAFISLFKGISTDELWNIRNNVNCHPLGYVKTTPYEITEKDLVNLKQYLDDIGFSGVVSLSDAKKTYSISSTNLESQKNVPFSIHSIAKVFTGTLALMTMPPEAFSHKLELDPSILTFLKKFKEPVFSHLDKPTLLQIMNHNGGFGDYLANYEKAIEDALAKGVPLPVVSKPEDFLKYAETAIYPLDKGHYSNLGILLVALAVQHQCDDTPFDELLEKHILNPAKMSISKSKPLGGKFSPKDPCQGMVVGGPSGGYWTSADELLKLGMWLQDKCKSDKDGKKSDLLSKLELYGGEFYSADDKEIRHNGCSGSGSSYLSSFLESGVTIAVLSDQSNFMANRIYYTIREKMIEKDG